MVTFKKLEKMKRLIYILFSLIFIGCGEESFNVLDADQDYVPEPVTNIRVENHPGKVKIDYDFKENSNALYVEAEYIHSTGQKISTKSSYYNNTVELSGFGESKEYEVTLYSVGRNLKKSAPTVVKVYPLQATYESVYKSLILQEDFGGMRITTSDGDGSPIVIIVEKFNSNGEWENVENIYTQEKAGVYFIRGLKPEPMKFRVYTKDRWNNYSDYRYADMTPYYEEELDYSKFKHYRLPNDPADFAPNYVYFLWNDNVSSNPSGGGGWYRTANGTGVPNHITIDMGQSAKLSRMKFHQRGYISNTPLLYNTGDVKRFELWGSNAPAADGSWDSWTRIDEFEIIKPSGSPITVNTSADIQAAIGGREFPMPLDIASYRYIRLKVLETWGIVDYFWIGELDFFGMIEK